MVCDRCGNFACADCIRFTGLLRFCSACRERRRGDLPSLQRRATWAQRLLLATGVVYLGQGVSSYFMAEFSTWGRHSLLSFWPALFFLGCVGVYCWWFFLAVHFSREQGADVSVAPWMAVASWFVPWLNVYLPFALMRKMLPATPKNAILLLTWQLLAVACALAIPTTLQRPLDLHVQFFRDVAIFIDAIAAVLVIRVHTSAMTSPVR